MTAIRNHYVRACALLGTCALGGLLSASRAAPPADARPDQETTATKPLFTPDPADVRAQLDQAQRSADEAKAELQAAQAGVADLRAQIQQQTGRVDVSLGGILAAARKLEEQLQMLEVEDSGSDAREQATLKAVQEVGKKAQEKADAVARELSSVVESRQRELDRLIALNKAASVSARDVEAGRTALAEAKAQLAERQWQVAATAGGDSLGAWNKELLNLSISRAERTAQMRYIRTRLDRLKPALVQVDELEHRQNQLQRAQSLADQAEQSLHSALVLFRKTERNDVRGADVTERRSPQR